MERDLTDYAHEVNNVAHVLAEKILHGRNIPDSVDLHEAVSLLNGAVADSDLHGVAVYARVLHILTDL